MEDIADIDYIHAKRVFNYFNIKNLGNYHGLYVQSDTLLLADVFESSSSSSSSSIFFFKADSFTILTLE